jgi:hypothetical protein
MPVAGSSTGLLKTQTQCSYFFGGIFSLVALMVGLAGYAFQVARRVVEGIAILVVDFVPLGNWPEVIFPDFTVEAFNSL